MQSKCTFGEDTRDAREVVLGGSRLTVTDTVLSRAEIKHAEVLPITQGLAPMYQVEHGCASWLVFTPFALGIGNEVAVKRSTQERDQVINHIGENRAKPSCQFTHEAVARGLEKTRAAT